MTKSAGRATTYKRLLCSNANKRKGVQAIQDFSAGSRIWWTGKITESRYRTNLPKGRELSSDTERWPEGRVISGRG